MNKYEEILDKNAKRHMLRWNIRIFRRTHPRLLKTIIEAMKEIENGKEDKQR